MRWAKKLLPVRTKKSQVGIQQPRQTPDSQPRIPSFPDGIKILYDCPNADVDICFVHGLTGDRESTWTAEGQSNPWPKTLLPQKLPKARILTFGYDGYVLGRSVVSMNGPDDHALNLLNDLTTDREFCNASSRPIIFVAHGLGGLVCKEAILSSRNHAERHLRDIFSCTKGIIFMGTPHRGSRMADWAKIPASVISHLKSVNQSLLGYLQPDNQLLNSVQRRFWDMVRQQRESGRSLEITCFYEELPLYKDYRVVPKESATMEGYTSISIRENHSRMVKFVSAEDNGFKRVVGNLARWVSQIASSLPVDPPPLSPECLDCLRSLAFPQMESRFLDIVHAASGTCDWLLQHDTYKNWTACDRGLLWIKGKPGAGKSTLLKHAFTNTQVGTQDLVLSFFFHARGDELQRTPLGFFRFILHQILEKAPDSLSDLITTFKSRRHTIGEPGEKWQWHKEELRAFFRSCLPKVLESRSVWLFVDALDECGKEDAVRLAEEFSSLLENSPSSAGARLRICVSCRHYPILGLENAAEICVEDENEKDISNYVEAQIGHLFPAASSIPKTITDRASGIFLWAVLMVKLARDRKRSGASYKAIDREIRSVLSTLEDLYNNLVQEMREKSPSLQLIRRVCFATWLQSLDELRLALIIDLDYRFKTLQECLDTGNLIYDCSMVKCECCVMETQFIHQSVKDFFVTKGLAAIEGKESMPIEAAVSAAHRPLPRTYVRYLAMEEIAQAICNEEEYNSSFLASNKPTTMQVGHYQYQKIHTPYEDFPLLRHAPSGLEEHLRQCDVIQDDLWKLLDLLSDFMKLWTLVLQELYPSVTVGIHLVRGASLLHAFSLYGVLTPLRAILQRQNYVDTHVDSKDSHGQTPLLYAALGGHTDIMRWLLATGRVDPDSADSDHLTPLLCAARFGWTTIAEDLLATGRVDPDFTDHDGRTPLSWAAGNGSVDIMERLLATGQVNPEYKDIRGRTPLSWAAARGQIAAMKRLLATGQVNPDSRDNSGQTPFSYAAASGQIAAMECLLATGLVDPESRDVQGRTPLSYAVVSYWNTVAMEVLIATGQVDPDSRDNYGHTPFSWAASAGRIDAMRCLIATGQVDPDSRDTDGQTPLLLAAKRGDHDIVRYLLETGQVNPESTDTYGRTPLS